MKLWNKRKYAWLTMAVMTALFSGTTAMAQTTYDQQVTNEFTTTLNGVREKDQEYHKAGVIKSDGLYQFTQNSSITTTNAHGADMNQATTIDAKGKTLTFNTNVTDNSTIHTIGANTTDGVTITANKLVLNANSTKGRVEAINVGGQGQQNKDKPMKLTINGDTEMNVKGINYALGLYAAGNSEVTFNGNVTAMGNENSEWGLTSEKGAYGYYGCSLVYSGSNYTVQMGPKVTINGDVNAKIDGNCLFANGGHAKLTINGGGNIEINKDNTHNYYAMMAESGTTSMNVNLDANYDAISARDNKLVLKGNVGASTGAINANEPELYTKVNLGLATADSVWTGVAHNGFKDEGNKAGDKTFYGAINVFLQNGATWNNEKWGETSKPYGGRGFKGSHVAKFVGGVSDAKSGNIFQNDSNNLTIDNYSGNTNIFYAHTGNGEAAENYVAGDTIIRSAAAGSAVSMITDNKGVAMDNKDSVANVLNALAGKLTYSSFVTGEKNLTGFVKIAGGLTSSSAALKTGDISFSTEDSGTKTPGQGYYDYKPSGEKPEYNTGAIKNSENISKTRELDANGIAKVEVTDPTILEGYSKFAAALYAEEASVPMNVKMAGKGLALSSAVEGGAQAAGIFVANGANITIDNPFVKQKLAITATNNSTYGAYGIFAKGDSAKLNISGPVEITDVTTKGAAVGGIVVRGQNTDVVIDGPLKISNVKAESDNAMGYNGFGIGVTGVGSTVAINGTVDISGIHGSAILLKESGNKVSVGGGNIAAAVDSDKSHNYYAARVEKGTLDINMKDGVAGDTTTTITGDMYINCLHGMKPSSLGSTELVDFKEEGVLNVALTNADSYWKGVAAHEKYKTDKHQYGYDMHDVGDLNLYLQNGATWTNEQQSHATTTTVKDGIWDGSTLASLHGGSDAAHAGHIFQNDSKNITINNYSGNTNIYYAHTGNGEAAENYAAGDTIIKHAEKDSVVSMITANNGIAMDNKDSVANVLNALAGKLTYSNFATGEKNLTGVVKIAAGLTASSKALETGDITFNEKGKGTYIKPEPVDDTHFTDKITGGSDKKYAEAGIEKEKGVYTFTKDATIKVTKGLSELGAIESSGGPITINADGKALDVSYTVPKGDNVARAVATGSSFGKSKDITIKADSLKLSADTTGFRAQGVYAKDGKITIDANTTIAASAKTESNGIYSGGIVTMSGNLTIQKDTKADTYYALNADDNGVINVNMKDGKAGAGIVKLDGDVFTKSEEIYDEDDDETTSTSSTVNLALQGKDSSWNGRSLYGVTSGDDSTSYGTFNLWLTEGATWTNEKNGKEVPSGFAGSHVTNFTGGSDAAHAGNIFQNDTKNITIDNYSGNINIFYAHTGNGEAAGDYAAGDTIIKHAEKDSVVSMITANNGIAMDNKDSVANVLNALAGKLTYSNFATGEKNLTGVVKIAAGLTASSKALETGDITFNEKGKGTYVKSEPVDDTHFTEKITGAMDQKYVDLGIEKEKGVYTFVKDTVIDVTKGNDTAMVAIASKDGPVTINAEGKTLDVSFHSDRNFAARAIASQTYYGGEPIIIKAGKLNLNAEAVDGESQGIFAKVGSTITIDADTTINTSSNKESNGIYAGSRGVVNMNGNLNIKEDTKAAAYYALKTDGNGVININLKDGNAGDSIVKFTGDIYAKTHESSINLALKGEDSQWTGRSLNESADSEQRGSFNLWLTDGASWSNPVTGKNVPSGFTGSHVTNFTGGSDAAHAGNIFQNDTKNITIDNYSGNINIFYAHTGNGEAAGDYAAGDTIIKHAEKDSVVSMITDNSGIAMDNEYSVANVLNTLAGKLTYSNFTKGEKNLAGYVKIAEGLTASSVAMQTGNIAFSDKDGKGSLAEGTVTPGVTYPEEQVKDTYTQAITGITKDDYIYKQNGVLKEEGKYTFTKDPTKIEVESGAAVKATDKDINIDTTKAKLELKGETGIHANGADVTVKGSTEISGNVGIDAVNGNVTLTGSTVINGTDAAINAGADANVVVNGNNSALTINGGIHADGGSITVDSGKATGIINGDVNASNGGSVEISLNDAQSKLTGSYKVDANSGIVMNIKNGATWVLTDDKDETAGMSLLRMAKAPAAAPAAGLTVNGGATKVETGYIDMTKRTKTLDIAHYSGWETVIYHHDGKGDKVEDYKSGDTVIAKADKGSGVILSTDVSGITMTDKNAVEATLKALAQKVTYKDHAANGENLSGKVQIAEGLTSSSVSKNLGTIHWDENGKGQYDLDSVNWNQIIEGDYETFVMKGVRSAATTSLHSWRDNMQDTYTGADLADEDGIFAKALGGKTSSDVSGLKDSNSYWGAQIGYDKALANGWHTGIAFDYRDGDSDYLLGGKGDNKLYSFGVYGVKKMEDGSYFRVAAKAGRVENEYDVYTELRNKLHADYKANAYGLTAEYGKTFGSEMSYITPKVQLTWSRVGSKDYTGSANNGATMNIYQDSYDSLVGRLGFEAGMKKAHGSLHAGLYLAHEFNGDIDTRYFAKDGGWKSTSFDGDDTWAELVLGGEYRLGRNSQLYADFARDLGGDFQRKWKLNAGIRLRF